MTELEKSKSRIWDLNPCQFDSEVPSFLACLFVFMSEEGEPGDSEAGPGLSL